MILFTAFLITGIASILSLAATYMYIIFKHKKIDAIFNFYDYATPKELLIIKIASIGLVVTIILFILM